MSILFYTDVAFSKRACILVGNFLFLIGGKRVNFCITDAVDVFDFKKNKWHKFPEMFFPRHRHLAVLCDENIVVVGGYINNTTICSSVERYDIRRNVWYKCTDLPITLADAYGCFHNDSLYVCGGHIMPTSTYLPDCGFDTRGYGVCNMDILKYDFQTKLWTVEMSLDRRQISHIAGMKSLNKNDISIISYHNTYMETKYNTLKKEVTYGQWNKEFDKNLEISVVCCQSTCFQIPNWWKGHYKSIYKRCYTDIFLE